MSLCIEAGETLLDATLYAGGAIAFACLSGQCGACRVTILDGRDHVVMDGAGNLAPKRDEALACIARLTGPVRFRAGVGAASDVTQ